MGERRTEDRTGPAGGDDDRIDQHLDTIFAVARATALSKGVNTYEADEVAQLTAYKLWRRWEDSMVVTLRAIGGTRWRGYIRKVAINAYIDQVRQHQRRLARQLRAEEVRTGRPAVEGADHLQPAQIGDVEQWLARHSIHELILLLPAQQQKVAARVWLLEMSVREVALELGLQEQTIRKHARAARENLRQLLNESEEEPQPLL